MNRVKVFTSSVDRTFGAGPENFGDNLMQVLLNELFNVDPEYVEPQQAELIGVGSIIDVFFRRHLRGRANAASPFPRHILRVWGSGFMNADTPDYWPQKVIYHAVRGPLSRARVMRDLANEIALGDPALLLPLIWPKPKDTRCKVAVIPHYATYRKFLDLYESSLPKHWTAIDLLKPSRESAESIASSEFVISSSLHGLIVADAYGIPSCWMNPHGTISGDEFKFLDYSHWRGRPHYRPVDYETFLQRWHEILESEDYRPRPPTDVETRKLLESFPFG